MTVQVVESPEEEKTEVEEEWESSDSEADSSHETPRWRITFGSPIRLQPASPLPPFPEPEPPVNMGGHAPIADEFRALLARVNALRESA